MARIRKAEADSEHFGLMHQQRVNTVVVEASYTAPTRTPLVQPHNSQRDPRVAHHSDDETSDRITWWW
jgi:hypothetical protein